MALTQMRIGGHIAALRKAKGLTQEQLAERLGRNVKTIDRLASALRADGLLVVEPRWAENGGQLANCYRLARAK